MMDSILEVLTYLNTPIKLLLWLLALFYYLKYLNKSSQQQEKSFEQIELIVKPELQEKINGKKFISQLQQQLQNLKNLQLQIQNFEVEDDKAYQKIKQQIYDQEQSQQNEDQQIKQKDNKETLSREIEDLLDENTPKQINLKLEQIKNSLNYQQAQQSDCNQEACSQLIDEFNQIKNNYYTEITNKKQLIIAKEQELKQTIENENQFKEKNQSKIQQAVQNQIQLSNNNVQEFNKEKNHEIENQKNLNSIVNQNIEVINLQKNFQNAIQQLQKSITKEITQIETQFQTNINQKYLTLLNQFQTQEDHSNCQDFSNATESYVQELNTFIKLIEQIDGLIGKQQVGVNKALEYILNLYKKTSQLRAVDYQFRSYVRNTEDFNELKRNYNLNLPSGKELKTKYCDSFRPVRGDGNCFYTAFGFQFLQHLLVYYQQFEFEHFINHCKKDQLPMKLLLNEEEYVINNEKLEEDLLNEFLNRLIKLRQIQNQDERFDEFLKQFAAHEYQNDEMDGCLYALSTIFLRNYSNYAVEAHEMKDALFDRINLLVWEKECNSNEIVIDALSRKLNLHTTLIYFDDRSFQPMEYGDQTHPKIILLIRPGHYNIGINSAYEEELKQNYNGQLQQQEF